MARRACAGWISGVIIAAAGVATSILADELPPGPREAPPAAPDAVTKLLASLAQDPGLTRPEVPAGTEYVRIFAKIYSDGRPPGRPVQVADSGESVRRLEARKTSCSRRDPQPDYWLIISEGEEDPKYWTGVSNTLQVLAEFVTDPNSGRLESELAELPEGVVSVVVPFFAGAEARIFLARPALLMKRPEPILRVPLGLAPPAPPGGEAKVP